MEENRQIKSSDLHFCAFLRAKYKLPITEAVRNGSSGRVYFVFDPRDHDPATIKQEYFTSQAEVNVRRFCDELRYLKAMIFNEIFPMNGGDDDEETS